MFDINRTVRGTSKILKRQNLNQSSIKISKKRGEEKGVNGAALFFC
jgi:hypothetical protein